jgi:curved DNA-binding protein
MDYYSTLGLKRGATADEIKRAYRSLAMKHHPDRGGNEQTFKDISVAYDVLSDPQKRQMFDAGQDPNNQRHNRGHEFYQQGPFEFHFGGGQGPSMDDIFSQFGFGFGPGHHRARRNRSVNISVELTLSEVINGKELNAEITIPGGEKKLINIVIPAGLEHGQQVKYQGMGDNTFKEVPAGDLIVNVFIQPHPLFKREGDALVYEHTVSAWDAILGTAINLETIDGKNLSITVPAGTQPDTVLSCRGEGLTNARSKIRGPLLIKIKVAIPRNLDPTDIDKIAALRETSR